MTTPPVVTTVPNEAAANATATKRILFRIALCVAMIGSIIVSTMLFAEGGLSFNRLRHLTDIGQHSFHLTSLLLLTFGLLSISTFIILTIALVKVNRNYAIIAAAILILCSLGLIAFSIWSFYTISSDQLQKSINNTLIKELDQTQFSIGAGTNITIDNTLKMAQLEKQYQCCGINDPIEDYQNRQPANFRSALSAATSTKGRTTQFQKNPSMSAVPVLLPFSCCNEKYRSNDHHSCVDAFGNNTTPLNRYNTEGCYSIIIREKLNRIQRQGVLSLIAASLAVISSIALAAVIKLLNEGYQVVPIRTST